MTRGAGFIAFVVLAWTSAATAGCFDDAGSDQKGGSDSASTTGMGGPTGTTGRETTSGTSTTAPDEPDVSLWWSFEGTIEPGGRVPDQSGNGHDATVWSEGVNQVPGPVENAASFPFSTSVPLDESTFLTSTTPSSIRSAGDFTIEVWAAFEIDEPGSTEWFLSASHQEPPSVVRETLVSMHPEGALLFCAFSPEDPAGPCVGSSAPCQVDGPTIADGSWHHYALRWSGGPSNVATYFIDGVPGPDNAGCDADVGEELEFLLEFGSSNGAGGFDPVDGLVSVDEIRIWDGLRSDAQVCEAAGRTWSSQSNTCEA